MGEGGQVPSVMRPRLLSSNILTHHLQASQQRNGKGVLSGWRVAGRALVGHSGWWNEERIASATATVLTTSSASSAPVTFTLFPVDAFNKTVTSRVSWTLAWLVDSTPFSRETNSTLLTLRQMISIAKGVSRSTLCHVLPTGYAVREVRLNWAIEPTNDACVRRPIGWAQTGHGRGWMNKIQQWVQ